MQPHLPLWTQRLPAELRRRLELAEAAAIEARSEAHAREALNLVAVLAPRMPFDEAIERYMEVMGLTGDEAEVVHTRALVALGASGAGEELALDRERRWGLSWKTATPMGAFRFVRRQMRRNAEEDLWVELSAARAEEAITRTHVRHALSFVEILADHAQPPRAVALYLDQLHVPAARARAVYQRTLARIAEKELPRFRDGITD